MPWASSFFVQVPWHLKLYTVRWNKCLPLCLLWPLSQAAAGMGPSWEGFAFHPWAQDLAPELLSSSGSPLRDEAQRNDSAEKQQSTFLLSHYTLH